MRTYIAATENRSYTNGWFNCLKWAQSEVEDSGTIIKIHVARPDVKTARIVAEVTVEGIRVYTMGGMSLCEALELCDGWFQKG